MSIIGLGAYNNVFSNMIYAGISDAGKSGGTVAAKSLTEEAASTKSSAATTSGDSVIVTLSESVKRVSIQTDAQSFKDVGMAARAKLNTLIQQVAKKTGIHASEVNIQGLEISDFASFSDQELAAINLNSSGNFSEAEQVQANALLAERMRVSLEPYRISVNQGDGRGQAMAINALYNRMTPEVRRALGWDSAMMVSNNSMLASDEQIGGKLDNNAIITNLRFAQHRGGLMFDKQPSNIDLSIYSFSVSVTATTGIFGE